MQLLLFFICLIASSIGAISGIGGGIIIKPIVDSLNIMDIYSLNFLSTCTVFSMSCFSMFKNKLNGIKMYIPVFLGIGSIFGGMLGKQMFSFVGGLIKNNVFSLMQSLLLLLLNIFILIFMLFKSKINSKCVTSKTLTLILGFILGIVSSFLGIGGGPLNIAFIYYFYSLDLKQTTIASLVIVFFSQISNLGLTILQGIPNVEYFTIIVMCLGGVFGAIIGSSFSKKMSNEATQKFFVVLIVFLIMLNIYNIFNDI